MSFAIGTRVGPYEIQRTIGRGGMGEVYGAVDTRLGRTVAIKVLTTAPTGNDDRLKRFEQEARAVGALNHPNLVTLYDIGSHDGSPFIVTELLEGRTLRAMMADRALPIGQALTIAADVARGLAAAHGAKIIHRDIKPDNLFITRDRRIKILDFGIAKLRRDEPEATDKTGQSPALGPTLADTPMTSTGMVIGTPGYMSPEQLQGADLDERTDVFSLGVVLYEMVAGRRPFAAPTTIEESYNILKNPPPTLGEVVPVMVERLITRCLEKEPQARFQSASDLAFALDALDDAGAAAMRRPPSVTTPPPGASNNAMEAARNATGTAETQINVRTLSTRKPKAPRWRIAAVCGVIVLVAAAAWIGRATKRIPDASSWPARVDGGVVYRRVTYNSMGTWNARLELGGTAVLYSITPNVKPRVVRSRLDHPGMEPLFDGVLLDISPKGELAVVDRPGGTMSRGTDGAFRRAPGESVPRIVTQDVDDASWDPDGDRLAVVRADRHVIEFPVGTKIVEYPGQLRFLRISPDGNHLAYCETANETSESRIVIVDVKGKEVARSQIQTTVFGLAWASADEVWFATHSNQPQDHGIRGIDLRGRERFLIHTDKAASLMQVGDNRLLAALFEVRFRQIIVPRGKPAQDASWLDGAVVQGVSRDGKRLVFVQGSGTGNDRNGYAAFLRSDGPPRALDNAFRLAMLSDTPAVIALAGSPPSLRRIDLQSGAATELPRGRIARYDADDFLAISWSDRWLAFRAAEANKPMRLWVQDLQGGPPRPVGPDALPATEHHPISPDGAWIALANPAGGIRLLATNGGADKELAVAEPETPLGFTGDGSAVFVLRRGPTWTIHRLVIASGERAPWSEITPPESRVAAMRIDEAGEHFVYSTLNMVSADLYLLEPPERN